MNKLYLKLGNVIAGLALVFATVSVNTTCHHFLYQDEIPESVKILNKVK